MRETNIKDPHSQHLCYFLFAVSKEFPRLLSKAEHHTAPPVDGSSILGHKLFLVDISTGFVAPVNVIPVSSGVS